MKNLLDVIGLCTTFETESGPVRAVDDVSFSLRPGEILGIVGESGCGKSVTAESIMRLLDEKATHYSGAVRFRDEVDLQSLDESQMRHYRGSRIAMIFQDPMSSLNPVFTVGDQLVEAIRAHSSMSKSHAWERAVEILRLTDVPDPELRMKQYPHQLSGGQRQRVMIAMAVSCDPDLLIADEPTTALDVTTQAQILRLILDLKREFDTGVIFITHDLGVVAEICHRVVVMYLGEVIEVAEVNALFDSPLHPYTRGLMASTPSRSSDPDKDLPIIPGSVPTLHNVPRGCRFADRCEFVVSSCRSGPIGLRDLSDLDSKAHEDRHYARCIRAEEIVAMSNAGKGAGASERLGDGAHGSESQLGDLGATSRLRAEGGRNGKD